MSIVRRVLRTIMHIISSLAALRIVSPRYVRLRIQALVASWLGSYLAVFCLESV